MSKNIVTRLRGPNWTHPSRGLLLEAAAEIEFLRLMLATADRRVADMREAAARAAEWAHMVPPDGGSPTAAEQAVAEEAARRIRALPLPNAPEPQGWRDIATAPRDGTEVLVWTGSEWLIASWRIGAPPYPFEGWTTGWETAGGYDVGYAPISPPTHWQPLPEPPPARTAQGDAGEVV